MSLLRQLMPWLALLVVLVLLINVHVLVLLLLPVLLTLLELVLSSFRLDSDMSAQRDYRRKEQPKSVICKVVSPPFKVPRSVNNCAHVLAQAAATIILPQTANGIDSTMQYGSNCASVLAQAAATIILPQRANWIGTTMQYGRNNKQSKGEVEVITPPGGSKKAQQVLSSPSDQEYLSANDSSHDRSQIDDEVLDILESNGLYVPSSDDEYFQRESNLSVSDDGSISNTPNKKSQSCILKRKSVAQYTSGESIGLNKNKLLKQETNGSTKKHDDDNNNFVYSGRSKELTSSPAWLKHGIKGSLLYKICGPNYNALNQPVGVTQLSTGEVVVADTFNDRMVLFSSRGKFLKSFSAPNMKRPSAVVALTHGNFIVKDHYSIDHFDVCCNYIGPLYQSALLKNPYGLAVTEEGKLITMETGKEGFITLVIMDINGVDNIIRMLVNLKLGSREARFSKPRFITHQGDSVILVVDLGLDCIFKINYSVHLAQGEVCKRIGRSGKKDGEFIDPSGIVVDDDKYILVCDSKNHRIQVFDAEGMFLNVLKLDVPLKRPSGMFLNTDGELLVINYWENNVAVYQLSRV